MTKKLPMKPVYTDEDDLQVAPLTDDERAWIEAAAKLFAKMPKRLKLMEGGDCVSVVDADGSTLSNCADGAARADGILLADLPSAMFKIFGVSA